MNKSFTIGTVAERRAVRRPTPHHRRVPKISSWAGVGEWPRTTVNMYDLGVDDAESMDAQPDAINSAGNAFGVAWKSYGDVE